jgi:hypothetical protein
MKNTKKESNKSKNHEKRREKKENTKNRSIETKLSRGPLFFVFCPVEETTSVFRLLRSVTHNNNNNNNARIKSTQHALAPTTVFVSQTKTESRDKCVKVLSVCSVYFRSFGEMR